MLNKSKDDKPKEKNLNLDDLFASIEATKPEERKRDNSPADKYAPISVQDKYIKDFFSGLLQTPELRDLIPKIQDLNDIYRLVTLEYLISDMDKTKKGQVIESLSTKGTLADKLKVASSMYISGVDQNALADSYNGILDAIRQSYIKNEGKLRLDSLRGYEAGETIAKISNRKSLFPKVIQAIAIVSLIIYGIMHGYNRYKDFADYQEKFIQHVTETYQINPGP